MVLCSAVKYSGRPIHFIKIIQNIVVTGYGYGLCLRMYKFSYKNARPSDQRQANQSWTGRRPNLGSVRGATIKQQDSALKTFYK